MTVLEGAFETNLHFLTTLYAAVSYHTRMCTNTLHRLGGYRSIVEMLEHFTSLKLLV